MLPQCGPEHMPTSEESKGKHTSHTDTEIMTHSEHHSEIVITHQWSTGEVIYVERIHLELKVNTVGMLCAADKTTKGKLTDSLCIHNDVSCLCVTHRQRMSV